MDWPAPTRIGEFSFQQTVACLSRTLPDAFLKTKSQGGQTLHFITWYGAVAILNRYCPGWSYDIISTDVIAHPTKKDPSATALLTKVAVTLNCSDGVVTRMQQGIELYPVSGYGDSSSNALSMAFRRCVAQFGLALHLYSKANVMPVDFEDIGEGPEE
jgi:hypothetical protein